MAPDVTNLRKILALERKKGCRDRAVIGGLDSYLNRWGSEARDSLAGPQIQMLTVGYAALDMDQRWEWIERVIGWLDGVESGGDGCRLPKPVIFWICP